jgi:hypothetical protein
MAVGAVLLGGCATYPYDYSYNARYYDRPAYTYYDRPAYRYYNYDPVYYPRRYVEPSSSFGVTYYGGGGRYWNEHHE